MYDEYTKQLIKINKLLQKKIKLRKSKPYDEELIKYISDLNYFKSNLELGLAWKECGHEPGVYQGIDNISACKVY
jgi:hypothetical protein